MANYAETDMAFYSEKPLEQIEIIPYTSGNLIKWTPVEGVGGYAIYRGNQKDEFELLITIDEDMTEYFDDEVNSIDLFEYQVKGIIEGDFILEENPDTGLTDFKLTENYESARQDIVNRLRTQKGDWSIYPELGANLEEFEGEPNTRQTGEKIAEQCFESLTYDQRFDPLDVAVRPVPTKINKIDVFTVVETDDDEPIIHRNDIEL